MKNKMIKGKDGKFYCSLRQLLNGECKSLHANLSSLTKEDIKNTCFDPKNKPNGIISFDNMCFKKDGKYIVGYRSKKSIIVNKEFEYEEGKMYEATFFSTSYVDCHPGLYVFPTLKRAKDYVESQTFDDTVKFVKVWMKKEEIHRCRSSVHATKWRCKKFYKVRDIK